jgi:hypothetical protein
MDIWELVSLVALCYASYKLGQWSVVVPIVRGIRREIAAGRINIKDILKDDDEEDDAINIRLERHGNVYYAYALDGDFLAQGTSFTELFDRFHARFPLQSFNIQKNTDLSDSERDQMILALEALAKRMSAK